MDSSVISKPVKDLTKETLNLSSLGKDIIKSRDPDPFRTKNCVIQVLHELCRVFSFVGDTVLQYWEAGFKSVLKQSKKIKIFFDICDLHVLKYGCSISKCLNGDLLGDL